MLHRYVVHSGKGDISVSGDGAADAFARREREVRETIAAAPRTHGRAFTHAEIAATSPVSVDPQCICCDRAPACAADLYA